MAYFFFFSFLLFYSLLFLLLINSFLIIHLIIHILITFPSSLYLNSINNRNTDVLFKDIIILGVKKWK